MKKIFCLPEYKLPPLKENFLKNFEKRISRITAEFIQGFGFVSRFKKAVGIFGSTRVSSKHYYYQEARQLAGFLAKAGFTVITGGGPGIMEAANRGAFEAGGESVGLNIKLDGGQVMNKFVKKPIGFNYFFTRKTMFSFACRVYIFFPGGFGTLDEFFEMLLLIQTKKLRHPALIITLGKSYWQSLFDWLRNEVYQKQKAISKKDLAIFQLVDSAEEAFEIIKKHSLKNGNN